MVTSFQFKGDNCLLNLAIFRKHVSQQLPLISSSNLGDALLKVGSSNRCSSSVMTLFPFWSLKFDGMEFSIGLWFDHLLSYVLFRFWCPLDLPFFALTQAPNTQCYFPPSLAITLSTDISKTSFITTVEILLKFTVVHK